MNLNKLKFAESRFLQKYPNGFMHPEMQALGKKHKMDQTIELTQTCFAKPNFSDAAAICENMIKIISRSSMVSMFEKPKFRDFIRSQNYSTLKELSTGLKQFLYGNQEKGFEIFVRNLVAPKLAKWSLVTILPNYYHPHTEVFIKPTTAKGVIEYFELKNLKYQPLPTWEFYQGYKNAILTMKDLVDSSIAPNNAAFSGFLMMSMEAQ